MRRLHLLTLLLLTYLIGSVFGQDVEEKTQDEPVKKEDEKEPISLLEVAAKQQKELNKDKEIKEIDK